MHIQDYLIRPYDTVRSVIQLINNNKNGIALVVDETGRLLGTITDGDIRRFMLAGGTFDELCSRAMHDKPVTVDIEASQEEICRRIKTRRLHSIPVLDHARRPVRVVSIRDLINNREHETVAVIMAGGEGKRLRPLTNVIPKPMIEVNGRPILEQVVFNLERSGIRKIFISVNYRAEIIEKHFKDGTGFDVDIHYLHEEKPLGTAGALSLLPELPPSPLLVMNGDVMTNVSFARLLEFHRQHRCVMTLAAIEYHLKIPYGVLDLAGHYILELEEKPSKKFLCNAGIYAIEADIVSLIPKDTFYNMTDLLQDTIGRGLPVAAFPIHEYWIDIGQKEDLERARRDLAGMGQGEGDGA